MKNVAYTKDLEEATALMRENIRIDPWWATYNACMMGAAHKVAEYDHEQHRAPLRDALHSCAVAQADLAHGQLEAQS